MEKLKRKRISTRRMISDLAAEIEENQELGQEILALRTKSLNHLELEFRSIQEKIEAECADDDFEKEMEEGSTITTLIRQTQDVLILAQARAKPEIIVNPKETITTNLPTIQLPFFYGKIEEFPAFFDLFQTLIDGNRNLSPVQKLHYLKSAMKGDASNTLQHINTTSENYQLAINLLKNRYDNKKILVNTLLDKIVNEPIVTSESSAELRRLLDNFSKNVNLLRNLKEPVWNSILVFLIASKLDSNTRRQWEIESPVSTIPDFKEIQAFLEKRIQALNSIEPSKSVSKPTSNSKPFQYANKQPRNQSFPSKNSQESKTQSFQTNSSTTSDIYCKFCDGKHLLYRCEKFQKAPVSDRKLFVSGQNLCFNCFRLNHKADACRGEHKCKTCGEKHHTLLHENSIVSLLTKNNSHPSVIPTAIVKVKDHDGESFQCRAILDGGSQETLISKTLADKLRFKPDRNLLTIYGLGDTQCSSSSGVIPIQVQSRVNNYSISVDAHIIPKITNLQSEITPDSVKIPNTIDLADPRFYKSGKIDLLLGVEVTSEAIIDGKIQDPKSSLFAQNTQFGWVINGKCKSLPRDSSVKALFCTSDPLDVSLQAFWKIEQGYDLDKILTPDEKSCEAHYTDTVSRLPNGRFCVQLPFKLSPELLGQSRNVAIRILKNSIRRLDENQLTAYRKFLDEYRELNHMRKLSQDEIKQSPHFYLPHHAVFRPDSETSKIRVVFNGSKKTSSGYSLNDILLNGPTIQEDLFNILIRFRTYPVAICADIEKMYRQIAVAHSDRKFQRIMWLEHGELVDYELTTVTYGLTSSSYQAIRSLHELANLSKNDFPIASERIMKDFYVDDFISGANDENSAKTLIDQINTVMRSGQFNLRKWRSNSFQVRQDCNFNDDSHLSLDLDKQCSKALGLWWNHLTDHFFFHLELDELFLAQNATKRDILSAISKLFDPLGFLSPVIVIGKIIMQNLWQEPVGWNDPVPNKILKQYDEMRNDLSHLQHLRIPRHVATSKDVTYELHGFADASEKAYAACIYVVTRTNISTQAFLLCSKTRVAPIKTVSLPRLELCAALLLAKLFADISSTLSYPLSNCIAYSDSTIVLSWLQKIPRSWKTFVANRVAKIQDLIPPSQWRHVASENNPADIASRGCTVRQLTRETLWWHGPAFLVDRSLPRYNKAVEFNSGALIEAKPVKPVVFATTSIASLDNLFYKISNSQKIVRILAYCVRFIKNARTSINNRQLGPLTIHEQDAGLKVAIKHVQHHAFADDIRKLKKKGKISKKSGLLSLCPFLDTDGILRVGGRLKNASFLIDVKHPYLLPKKHPFTDLVIRHYHETNFHATPQLLHSLIRQKFWILQGKSRVKFIYKRCVPCAANNAKPEIPQMGNLPSCRLQFTRPFANTGIDYCGPFTLKPASKLRYKTTYKAYVALFICMSTKAIHIELVSDLSTESFISTLKRFIARRGRPTKIYSDNGSNFIGAKRLIDEEFKSFLKNQSNQEKIYNFSTTEQIEWNFNPPIAPNFGGLWEAGVKSAKRIVKTAVGEQVLSFEEFYTVLSQVEACLNSRPITPLSDDPNDFEALTPGHFLIGNSLLAPPMPEVNNNSSIRKSFNKITQIVHHFWQRWNTEYIHLLQNRPKWLRMTENIKVGDLVIANDNNDVMRWTKGRVVDVHPGTDGIVRVITIKTSNGTYKRPVSKVARLPIDF